MLPYEYFVYSELKAERETDTFKLLIVTDEVVVSGYMLRRVENGIQTRELAWIAARPERYRQQTNEKVFISRIAARLLDEQRVSSEPGTCEHSEEVSHHAG